MSIFVNDDGVEKDEDERIYLDRLTKSVRNKVIEECARVADGFGDKYYFMSAVDIAAAIRRLKDKP